MRSPDSGPYHDLPDTHRLLAYVADLELEVDRLRKQGGFVRQQVRDGLRRVERLAAGPADPAELAAAVQSLSVVLDDLHDPPGYHPAHDQVVPIAVRPLAEQVFRAQKRLTGVGDVALRLDLTADHVEWFPARLRHILDNLFSNALRYRDPEKPERWVLLGLRASDAAYEFRVSDNGVGLPAGAGLQAFELLSRAAAVRAAGVGVGLPVVRLLVEQCGGSLTVRSDEGRGTDFALTLPRYDVADYLT
ncbi:MAG: ATP-binding protein [Gemmataceae bacterium]